MAKNRIFLDVETTGLQAPQNQVLEYAAIAVNSKGLVLEKVTIQILLKPSVIPSPGALAANKIDPYSDDWKRSSISEERAAEILSDFAEKYKNESGAPIFTAYNAQFDKEHVSWMLKRHGISFDSLFDGISDPYKTVQRLVEQKVIATKLITKGKRSYNSAKLEDVSEALGTKSPGPAHRALSDTETLMATFFKVYQIATGKEYGASEVSPETFEAGQVFNIISDSAASGLKTRHIKVITNNKEDKKIVAFDLEDYQRIGLSPSNVRTFNYDTIIDETQLQPAALAKLEDIYSSNLEFILSNA